MKHHPLFSAARASHALGSGLTLRAFDFRRFPAAERAVCPPRSLGGAGTRLFGMHAGPVS
eukprot:4435802-Alexandrium_andersonii.AAC.1